MGLEAEIEALKRQNHWLKWALFSTVTVLLIGVVTVSALAGITATRARAEARRAVAREEQARDQAEAAFRQAQEALAEIEARTDGGT